ncbi:MAG: hypothetical protein ACOC2T_00295 [Planctomycetota bacterium]
MTPSENQETRRCPGEKYDISIAICRARQANQYPKCLLCEYCERRPDEGPSTDPRVKSAIFGRNAVRGTVPDEINEYVMRKVGIAAAQYLRAEFGGKPSMVVGCDARENSRNLARVFCEGANAGGLNTTQIGVCTPDMAHFYRGTHKLGSAAFVTGCHAEPNVNGVRIYRQNGVPLTFDSGLDKVGLIARRLKPGRSKSPGRDTSEDVMEPYRAFMVKFAPRLNELKVAVDGACGMPGRVLPYVLARLPVEVVRSHGEPDRRSPLMGQPHPSQQVERSIGERIRSSGAQMGVAVDYDGDLCTFYDEDGERVRADLAAALICREMLHRMPGARVAYDVRFTAAVRQEIMGAEGRPLRSASDPRSMIKATQENDAVYAASMEGRHCFRDLFGAESPTLAILFMCSLLSRTEQTLSSLVAEVDGFARSGQISYRFPSAEAVDNVLKGMKGEFRDADRDSVDGLTFRFADWWFNARQGDREEVLNVTVEARDEDRMRKGVEMVERILGNYDAERIK